MYKLLIVDDEPLVQVGIKSMLEWDKMDIEIVGIASNGKTACQIIEDKTPDIVITDIKMPVMSGLELVKYCSENMESKPQFIILTSYEDFDMAREALVYHVNDYLVKLELTPQLLQDSVRRILEDLDTRKVEEPKDELPSIYYYQEKFYIQLLNSLFESSDQFTLQAKELGLSFDAAGYIACYCEIRSANNIDMSDEKKLKLYHSSFQMAKELLSQYQNCHVLMLDLYHLAIIFYFDDIDSKLHINDELYRSLHAVNDTLFKYYMSYLACGLGNLVKSPLDIAESYQNSRDTFSEITDDNNILFFDNTINTNKAMNSFNFSIIKEKLSFAFEEYDSEALSHTIDEMTDLFRSNPHHYLQAIDFASNLLYLAISLLPNGENAVTAMFDDERDNYLKLYKMNNMEQILSWTEHFKTALCEYFTDMKKEVRKPVIIRAQKYIKSHIGSKLSLPEVAAALCISPNYLSQLFKKYNNIGFNDYVTRCKVEEAKRYLNNGELCIYEIAEKLGFESSFYFSKVFKKIEGISPSDYLKKI
ncbi:MAG: response regulator [Lachnospiraceae bacterium]|nr:response regulator [Lachnospiraceae bacterium]